MRRSLTWLAGLLLVGPVVFAQDAPLPTLAEQARQLRRHCNLVEMLGRSAMRLAGEEDPKRRAELCRHVAARLAIEIEHAEAAGEKARVEELRRYQRTLLEQWAVGSGLVSGEW
jgi:hypothetical protein